MKKYNFPVSISEIKTKEPEYEPYGKEWEKEIMKMNKRELIDFIRWIKQKK